MKKHSQYTIDWLIKKHIKFLEEFGLTETYVRNYFTEWSRNRPPLVKDYLWFIFQNIILEIPKQVSSEIDFYKYNLKVHSQMLDFRREIEKSPANDIYQSCLEFKLRIYEINLSFYCKVEVISGRCCEYCDLLNHELFEFSDIYKNKYLASDKCTNKRGCNCTYVPVPQRNSYGRLIKKQ